MSGETVKYIIADADNTNPKGRVVAARLTNNKSRYDVEEYLKLLADALCTILSLFKFTKQKPIVGISTLEQTVQN